MKLVLLRRVVGESMSPTLLPGHLIVALAWYRALRPGQIVVVLHDGLEKIKRIEKIDQAKQRIFVVGDNAVHSTDSRQFGWLPLDTVVAVLIWPRV